MSDAGLYTGEATDLEEKQLGAPQMRILLNPLRLEPKLDYYVFVAVFSSHLEDVGKYFLCICRRTIVALSLDLDVAWKGVIHGASKP